MKKKILLFLALTIVTSVSASNIEFSKDSVQPINKWVFKVGVNSVDSSGDAKASDLFSSFDQMAFSGTPLKINIERRLNRLFAFEVAGSLNKWKAGEGVIDSDYHFTLREDQDYFAVDGNLKFYVDEGLRLFRGSDWLELYISGGVGYFKVTEGGTTGNVGSGFNLWFSESIGLNFETVAKWILDSEPAVYDTGHIQYSLGLAFRSGDQDQDNDGIYDYNDKCPNIAGSKRNDGCPSDEEVTTDLTDFVSDYDSDNDGVKDNVDKCPNLAGLASNDGCPSSDSDGDGVVDTADNCPTIAGLPGNNGCPIVDTDGDGVIDSADNCPTIAGVASNGGCPAKTVTTPNNNNNGGSSFLSMTRKIQFNTNKYSFTNEAYSALEAIVSYMKQNSGYYYRIQGHADSVGKSSSNRTLSVRRAKAVKDYLISKGIPSEILTSEGFGESNPLELNSTKQGRAANRRIEIIELR